MTHRVVVAVEIRPDGFSDHALATVRAGQEVAAAIGSDVIVAVVAPEGTEEVPEVSWDVSLVVLVENAAGRLDGWAAQQALTGLLDAPVQFLLFMPHVGLAIEVAPALAAARGLGYGANVQAFSIGDQLTATRLRHGGKVVESIGFDLARSHAFTVRDGSYAPEPHVRASGPTPVHAITTDVPAKTNRVSLTAPESSGVDITKAEFVLSIGRGIGEQSNVARFAAIADSWGATLASSRPLVDVGWVDSARQVGQSGRTVKPKVYLAIGISGSVQHVAGMRSAQTIIVVNTDASAPFYEIADYGAVIDVDDLAEALEGVLATN